ncbi:MAG TPA: protein kinase [Pyrinomonadaceae bacterium]|nr:protein kinase [Pyrinomonadaceae bacterium]
MSSFLPPGSKLSSYEIRSLLGKGGMGEVYLAQDVRLGRLVALKVLPIELTQNQDRLRRFEQEARAASALNHPNIITIHEIGNVDSNTFIVTGFIEGESLRQLMQAGPMNLSTTIDITIQIGGALAAAQATGIVHRDIKPENVMIRADGIVKVLDFGLAKLSDIATADVDQEALTRAFVNTGAGVVMGTASYMSPEQAQGLTVDTQSDLWSLGVLIFEMVARRTPFEGSTPMEVIARIIEREVPRLSQVVKNVPSELDRIVAKTLTKNRDERYQTAKDLLIDLKRLGRQLELESDIDKGSRPTVKEGSSVALNEARTSILPSPQVTAAKTSSAEYIVTQIKYHKFAILAALLVVVAGGTALAFYLHSRSANSVIDSIAVLPFENQNHDPDSDYLADGLTDTIINNLSNISSLRVSSRNSVYRYKGKQTDPAAIANDLGVRAVLTGRILQRGDHLVVSAELVDMRDNKQVWGDSYSRKLADLQAVQGEIASQITQTLQRRLSGEEQRQLSKLYTENSEAYQLYLKGRYQLNKRTPESLTKGIDYFRKATEQDPGYALAYAGLADAYNHLGQWARLPPGESFPMAKAAAEKALQLDANLGEAHRVMAFSKFQYYWDFEGAQREYQEAIKLNPRDVAAREWHAYHLYLNDPNRFSAAMEELKTAQELDPLSLPVNFQIASLLYFNHQYDESINQLRAMHAQDPGFTLGYGLLGVIYTQKKMPDKAVEAWLQASALEGIAQSADAERALRDAYKQGGLDGYLRKHIEVLKEESKRSYISPYFIALDYGQLGDKDRVFEWLEKAYAERSSWLVEVRLEPIWEFVRSDPRYPDLLRRMGYKV